MDTGSPEQIPPRLRQVLAALADRAFAERLRQVYAAAAHAITRLSDMDLVKYESSHVEESPDLSLWEEMAPVIRDTVMDVNAVLSMIRAQFPADTPGGLAETVAHALEEVGGGGVARPAQRAIAVLQRALQILAAQITELGEAMRSPSVVSDRWNLLSEVQRFRTRFREEIGELVYESASTFEEVHRAEVVPGHEAEVRLAVVVRSTVADLVRLAEARANKVRDADPEDLAFHAQQTQKELDLFGRTPAYQALRAQDKRAVIELRHTLGVLAAEPRPSREALLPKVESLVALVRSLTQVNLRQLLVNHDREILAASGVRLEQADGLLASDPTAAAGVLAEAAATAQGLYGRDPALDAFLRKARKGGLAALGAAELKLSLDQFRELLAGLPL